MGKFELILKLFSLHFLGNFVGKKFSRKHLDGPMVKALDSQSRGPVFKPLGGSKVDSAFHLSKVVKMSIRNFCELSGKK